MTNNRETNTTDVEKAFESTFCSEFLRFQDEETIKLMKDCFTAGAHSRGEHEKSQKAWIDHYSEIVADMEKEIEQLREELDTEGRIQGELYCEKVAAIATAQDQLREAVEVVKRYEPYRVVTWVPVEGKNECVLREVWLVREFLTKHKLNSEEL